MLNTTEHEKVSLEAHVDLCALRYSNLDNRLGAVETKLDKLHEEIKNGHTGLVKVIIGSVGTIVASCLSIVIVLLMQ